MVLVLKGLFELALGHGSVWFLNVLGNAPEQEEVRSSVLLASECSLGFKAVFSLGGQQEKKMERVLEIERFEWNAVFASVFVKESSVGEMVPVFLNHLDLFEASGFLEDGSVKDGVVECGVVLC